MPPSQNIVEEVWSGVWFVKVKDGDRERQVQLSSHDVNILQQALESLYEDQIYPTPKSLKARLQLMSFAPDALPYFMCLYAAFEHHYIVTPEGSPHKGVLFKVTPKYFKGWIDPTSPEDPFSPEMWEAFVKKLEELLQSVDIANQTDLINAPFVFHRGRYGMAQELEKRNFDLFKGKSLGELCHIVELAIQKKLLAYEHNMLLPAKACVSLSNALVGRPTTHSSFGTSDGIEHISDKDELKKCVEELLSIYKEGFNLSTLKTKIKQNFAKRLSETAFHQIKLLDLVQSPPLNEVCRIEKLKGNCGYLLRPTKRNGVEVYHYEKETNGDYFDKSGGEADDEAETRYKEHKQQQCDQQQQQRHHMYQQQQQQRQQQQQQQQQPRDGNLQQHSEQMYLQHHPSHGATGSTSISPLNAGVTRDNYHYQYAQYQLVPPTQYNKHHDLLCQQLYDEQRRQQQLQQAEIAGVGTGNDFGTSTSQPESPSHTNSAGLSDSPSYGISLVNEDSVTTPPSSCECHHNRGVPPTYIPFVYTPPRSYSRLPRMTDYPPTQGLPLVENPWSFTEEEEDEITRLVEEETGKKIQKRETPFYRASPHHAHIFSMHCDTISPIKATTLPSSSCGAEDSTIVRSNVISANSTYGSFNSSAGGSIRPAPGLPIPDHIREAFKLPNLTCTTSGAWNVSASHRTPSHQSGCTPSSLSQKKDTEKEEEVGGPNAHVLGVKNDVSESTLEECVWGLHTHMHIHTGTSEGTNEDGRFENDETEEDDRSTTPTQSERRDSYKRTGSETLTPCYSSGTWTNSFGVASMEGSPMSASYAKSEEDYTTV